MKQYFKNLLIAICGKNPCRHELRKAMKKVERACESVSTLQESFAYEQEMAVKAGKQFEEMKKILDQYRDAIKKSDDLLVNYQNLVENLRERVKEKDAMIDEMRKEYQQIVKDYEKRLETESNAEHDLQHH